MICPKCEAQYPDQPGPCPYCGEAAGAPGREMGVEAGKRPSFENSLLELDSRLFLRHIPLLVFVTACFYLLIAAGAGSPLFFSSRNMTNVLSTGSIHGFIVIGMSLAVLTGKFDLSVGSMAALAGVMFVTSLSAGKGGMVSLLQILMIALIIGLIYAGLSCLLGVPSFLATLGSAALLRGIAFGMTDGRTLTMSSKIGAFDFGWSIPAPFVLMLVLALALQAILFIPSIGSSLSKAVRRGKTGPSFSPDQLPASIGLIACPIMAALAGILLSVRLNAGAPAMGVGFETDALIAVAAGGVCLSGGKGTIIGPLMAIFVLTMITNIMNLLGISAFSQMIVKAAILVFAVTANTVIERFAIRRGSKPEEAPYA